MSLPAVMAITKWSISDFWPNEPEKEKKRVVPDGGWGLFYSPGTWTVSERGKVRMPPTGGSRGIQVRFD